MEPTLRNGQLALYLKVKSRWRYKRGDLVVAKLPKSGKMVVKRLVGVGGDFVVEEGDKAVLANSKQIFNNAYKKRHWSIKDGEYFIGGDNTKQSFDSRHIGPLQGKQLVGKVFKLSLPTIKHLFVCILFTR